MKFDYVIGNPPYQDEKDDNSRKPPVYHLFMDEAFKVGRKIELITPGRFLFNAGQTPKQWNNKMLTDKHFKVLYYENDGRRVFPNNEIKGGIAISYRDIDSTFEAINVYTKYSELNSIKQKIDLSKGSLSNIMIGAVPYKFSNLMKTEHPETLSLIDSSYDLRTNVLDNLINIVFFQAPQKGYIKIFGQFHKKRDSLWIDNRYVEKAKNFKCYKVLISKASGKGDFGETLAEPFVVRPEEGHTQSYISMGSFNSANEANNSMKYLKTKFARALLGILKVTQDITPQKFKYVPLQDFSNSSDIDWSQSISDVDKQLYKKYDLSEEEINFIETHVKEME